ncbi:unknown [Ruminococcus sp. CAG:379]|uniref:hypothetical protein n=1 Tax=Ruminococcus sp. CAG:379 TaxID=1262956 RepID=UPI00033A0F2B|nr:hypothetical protein [Ruminococcus sp. CAG:379]CDD53411.1 unknown [Ruminococcus sp. CAG:379]
MIRDEKDDRSIADFVCDVCAPSGWLLKFYVTTIEDVKADPDAEPNERFTYEGPAEEFWHEMRMRGDEIAAILDEKVMQIAEEILCDYHEKVLTIDILY